MKEGGGGGGGGGGGDGGFVRADQIDLKSLDEQLERHLSRAWTMEKRKEEASAGANQRGVGGRQHSLRPRREDWEIDPAKLVVKGVIARGTFGTVHRGIYDGHDVAGTNFACRRDRRAQLPMRRPMGTGGRRRQQLVAVCLPEAPPFSCLFWQIAGVDASTFLAGIPWCYALLSRDISWIGRLLVTHVNRDHQSGSRDSCDRC